jgi:Rod binding domain-containing protein
MDLNTDATFSLSSTLPRVPASPSLPSRSSIDQADFSAVLGRHNVGLAAAPSTSDAAARKAAQEFVSIALVQPILTEARETSMAAEPFAPSSAEKQLQSLQDAALAQRITSAAHFPLIDRLTRDLVKAGPRFKGTT